MFAFASIYKHITLSIRRNEKPQAAEGVTCVIATCNQWGKRTKNGIV